MNFRSIRKYFGRKPKETKSANQNATHPSYLCSYTVFRFNEQNKPFVYERGLYFLNLLAGEEKLFPYSNPDHPEIPDKLKFLLKGSDHVQTINSLGQDITISKRRVVECAPLNQLELEVLFSALTDASPKKREYKDKLPYDTGRYN